MWGLSRDQMINKAFEDMILEDEVERRNNVSIYADILDETLDNMELIEGFSVTDTTIRASKLNDFLARKLGYTNVWKEVREPDEDLTSRNFYFLINLGCYCNQIGMFAVEITQHEHDSYHVLVKDSVVARIKAVSEDESLTDEPFDWSPYAKFDACLSKYDMLLFVDELIQASKEAKKPQWENKIA